MHRCCSYKHWRIQWRDRVKPENRSGIPPFIRPSHTNFRNSDGFFYIQRTDCDIYVDAVRIFGKTYSLRRYVHFAVRILSFFFLIRHLTRWSRGFCSIQKYYKYRRIEEIARTKFLSAYIVRHSRTNVFYVLHYTSLKITTSDMNPKTEVCKPGSNSVT